MIVSKNTKGLKQGKQLGKVNPLKYTANPPRPRGGSTPPPAPTNPGIPPIPTSG
jgi:hypothetical protein